MRVHICETCISNGQIQIHARVLSANAANAGWSFMMRNVYGYVLSFCMC